MPVRRRALHVGGGGETLVSGAGASPFGAASYVEASYVLPASCDVVRTSFPASEISSSNGVAPGPEIAQPAAAITKDKPIAMRLVITRHLPLLFSSCTKAVRRSCGRSSLVSVAVAAL